MSAASFRHMDLAVLKKGSAAGQSRRPRVRGLNHVGTFDIEVHGMLAILRMPSDLTAGDYSGLVISSGGLPKIVILRGILCSQWEFLKSRRPNINPKSWGSFCKDTIEIAKSHLMSSEL